MHEVSIMAQTLEIATEYAYNQGANQIHRLKMRIGALSGVVSEALNFAFDVVTKGTIAEGARLEIEIVPVVCYCLHCQIEFQPTNLFYECPQCDRLSNKIIAGREIELTSLEVS
jgi:hydrogenase nickel incorporation protein HypA/HybF